MPKPTPDYKMARKVQARRAKKMPFREIAKDLGYKDLKQLHRWSKYKLPEAKA